MLRTHHAADVRAAVVLGNHSFQLAWKSLPKHLKVQDSCVGPDAGRGVFADRCYNTDIAIIMLRGSLVAAHTQSDVQRSYSFTIAAYPLVALQMHQEGECNIVRYVNSVSGTSRQANVRICNQGSVLILYANCAIAKGDELLLDYFFVV
jgi:hypothetical protein